MESFPSLPWGYISIVPTLIAIINSVIAVWVTHFRPENQKLKVAILLTAIVLGLVAAGATVAGQRHAIEIAKSERVAAAQKLATLGGLIQEGDAFLMPLSNRNASVNLTAVDEWAAKTEGFLSKELGTAFVSRFRDEAGLTPGLPSGLHFMDSNDPHITYWVGLTDRLTRLQQFSEELSAGR